MAKYSGVIGYGISEETAPGVWSDEITEKHVKGDILQNRRSYNMSDKPNGVLNVSNKISIIADPYATRNFHLIKYLEFMGVKWIVTDVEVQYPRLILTLGGEYHE